MSTNIPHSRPGLLLAFFLIYFIWGSTYLAIRFAISSIPPFMMAGSRFLLAGVLMYAFIRIRGVPDPGRKQWMHLAIVGCFLFVGGNGLVVWAEQYIESGLAALLVATLPLWLIGLDWKWAGGAAPVPVAVVGILLGLVGMFILIDPVSITGSPVHLPGALVCILASALWATGSVHSRKNSLPQSVFMTAACQMIAGGAVLLIIATVSGEWARFEPAEVSRSSAVAFIYLVIAGSMIAISAYAFLLKNATATSISTYAFVNPVVAMFLGWLIADEKMTWQMIVGAMTILTGVVLVVYRPRKTAIPPVRE